MIVKLSSIIGLIALVLSPFALPDILSCKDNHGRVLFTDNVADCKKQDVKKVVLKDYKDKRANFRYPARSYSKAVSRYLIYFEKPESQENLKLQNKAVKKLVAALDFVFSKLPLQSHAQLKAISYYIMLGKRSALGGEDSGMRYITKGGVKQYSLHDKRWNNSVVIYSVDNFLYHGELWTHQPLCHELAHAWHLLNWPVKHEPILNAWLHARQTSLYLSVEDYKGRTVSPAYASTNQLEYFADLSAMFFVGGSYYPFDRKRLSHYDPKGYALILELWNES